MPLALLCPPGALHAGGVPVTGPWLSGAGCPTAAGTGRPSRPPGCCRRAGRGRRPARRHGGKWLCPPHRAVLRGGPVPRPPRGTHLAQALVAVEGAGAEALGEAGAVRGTGGVLGAQPGWGGTAGGDGARPGLLPARPHHAEGTPGPSRARGGGDPSRRVLVVPHPTVCSAPEGGHKDTGCSGRPVPVTHVPSSPELLQGFLWPWQRRLLPCSVTSCQALLPPGHCSSSGTVLGRRAQHRAPRPAPLNPPEPPLSPPYSQVLQVREAQEGAVGEGCQGVLRQVPANTPGAGGPAWGQHGHPGVVPQGDSGDGNQSVHGPAPSHSCPRSPLPAPPGLTGQ